RRTRVRLLRTGWRPDLPDLDNRLYGRMQIDLHRRRYRKAAVHTVEHLILKRVDRFVRERLMRAVHRERMPLTMSAWVAPGEPVPFAEALGQEFTPFPTGSRWGAPWGTTWFHMTGVVPQDWPE